MRTVQTVFFAAVFVAVFAAISAAQGQTPSPTPRPPPPPAPAPTQPPLPDATNARQPNDSYWTASGFIGSNFGAGANSASVDFGGQIAYLYRGLIGAEFLGDFAPNFHINNALLADNPNVNSYMANVIGPVPIGSEATVQPYVSGGLGGIQLRSDMFNIASTVPGTTT